MGRFLLPFVFLAAWAGAVYGGRGYDPGSTPGMLEGVLPGMVELAGFAAGWTILMILASPVVLLINEGRIDWRKVRTGRTSLAIGSALAIALMFAIVGAYRLAGGLTGGWPGGLRDGAAGALFGALIGVGLGVPANLLAARLRIANGPGPGDQPAEPAAAGPETPADGRANPAFRLVDDNGRPTVQGWGLILMLFGVITVLIAAKCLVFGPPPYSPLAYFIGPCLIAAGYLMNPRFIRSVRDGLRESPDLPPPGSGAPGSGGRGTGRGEGA